MFERLFGKGRKRPEQTVPDIQFGRYSDNNKSTEKVNRWTEADHLFKEKRYPESFDAFFDYLSDDSIKNVAYERNGKEGRFELFQGSKIVRGRYDENLFSAEVTLARMPQPSTPVMRRLLEMNFSLYYTRFALDDERLCMRFDSPTEVSNPNKLYYGLKELATKADKQDDLLVKDFTILEKHDTEHVKEIPEQEKETKYQFLQHWITETLDYVNTLDADKFHGGIAYLLLALAFRIDYLLVPEGSLMHDIEKLVEAYFRKDDRPVPEKNQELIGAFVMIRERSKEEVFACLYRSTHTFSIVAPQHYKTIADVIGNANQGTAWFRDNKYPLIAEKISEYGISYCQFSYSLPKPVTAFFELFMRVNYSDYFEALGFERKYYDKTASKFLTEDIYKRINEINEEWSRKYPQLNFRTESLDFENMMHFNQSFSSEIEFLNFENK
ncbi:MAG: hypothetical protein GC171_01975 [Terrimonas sp.]|nr:hypothetical protein [Terrimonas sp.]